MCVIPAIAFDSGINTDWHTLKKDFGQVLLLAGPGIVIVGIQLAIIFKYALGYSDLTWSEALLIGGILSATDPVAVISMLKEVGASNKIAVIIDGESLLNDGTAMVFYHVMAEIVKSGGFDVGDVIALFLRLTLGAWALGFLFALGAYFWFRRLTNDGVEATALTLFSAYLLFLLAEGTEVEVSGILAICSMGYFLSGFSGNVISPLVHESLHSTWSFIGWVAETFLFMLAGVIIGGAVLQSGHIDGTDWPLLLLLFVLLYLTRVVMIGIFYPILKYTGYSINWRNFLIFVHAGLRGGVALSLALIIWVDDEYSDILRYKLVFHAAGMAVMTVVINGGTGKFLLNGLGLADNSGEQELAINDATKTIISAGDKTMAKILQSPYLGQADWTKVVEYTGTRKMAEEISQQLTAGKNVKKRHRKESHSDSQILREYEEQLAQVDSSKRLAEARTRFILVLRNRYNYYRERGLCLPNSYVYLVHQVDIAADYTDNRLKTWDVVEPTVLRGRFVRIVLALRNIPLIKKLIHRIMYQRIGLAYDRCLAFYTAHEEAWSMFSEALPGLTADVLEDLQGEVRSQIRGCKAYMAQHLLDGYGLLVAAFQEKTAAVLILNKLRDSIKENTERGIITENEAGILSGSVDERLWKLFYANPVSYVPDALECVSTWHLLKDAPTAFLQRLIANSTFMLLIHEEILFQEHDDLQWVYLLIHGRVTEKNEDGVSFEHQPGAIIGAQYILSKQSTVNTTARANLWVFVRRIPVSVLQALQEEYEREIWKSAYPVLIMFSQSQNKLTREMSSKTLVRLVSKATISVTNPGEMLHLPFGGAIIPRLPRIDEEQEEAKSDNLTRQLSNGVVVFDPQQGNGVPMDKKAMVIKFDPGLYERWQSSDRDMGRVLREIEGEEMPEKDDIGRRATGLSGRDHDEDDGFHPSPH